MLESDISSILDTKYVMAQMQFIFYNQRCLKYVGWTFGEKPNWWQLITADCFFSA